MAPDLRRQFFVKRIGIFGSYARNQQTKQSDLDILVELNKPIGMFAFLDLEDSLSHALKTKVDLVTNKALKPAVRKGILKETIYA